MSTHANTAISTVHRHTRDNNVISPAAFYSLSKSNEWYTPARYIHAVRNVLGDIELDPASCEQANRVVQAGRYYTFDQDGLAQPWTAKSLFLNPPYGLIHGKSQAGLWTERLIVEYESGNVGEAILLVFASTSEKWFQPLFQYPLCFSNHRIQFYGLNGKGNQPTKGNAFVYFGKNTEHFARVFTEGGIGHVVGPILK